MVAKETTATAASALVQFLETTSKLLHNYVFHVNGESGIESARETWCLGRLTGATCMLCHKAIDVNELLALLGKEPVAMCPKCPPYPVVLVEADNRLVLGWSILRPNFYHSTSDAARLLRWKRDCENADLVLVLGEASPFPVPDHLPQIILGTEKPQCSGGGSSTPTSLCVTRIALPTSCTPMVLASLMEIKAQTPSALHLRVWAAERNLKRPSCGNPVSPTAKKLKRERTAWSPIG